MSVSTMPRGSPSYRSWPTIAKRARLTSCRPLLPITPSSGSPERTQSVPDTPTLGEAGYEDIDADIWQGIVAPANTPKETLARLIDWFHAALHVPEIKAKLVPLALYPAGICGAEFAAFLRKKFDDFGQVIRELD